MKKIFLLTVFLGVIFIGQAQISKTVNITAGTLADVLTANERLTISDLKITGTIDARDFKIMRDNIPELKNLDISSVKINSYTGKKGTFLSERNNDSIKYFDNTIPHCALLGCRNLSLIYLPESIIAIDNYAFKDCSNLTAINIPSSVLKIGSSAFNAPFFDDSKPSLKIPSSVTEIGENAFGDYSLTSINITPANKIGKECFNYSKLTSIHVYSNDPNMVNLNDTVFYIHYDPNTDKDYSTIDYTYCTLFVPIGSKDKYKSSKRWGDFVSIVEESQDKLPAYIIEEDIKPKIVKGKIVPKHK